MTIALTILSCLFVGANLFVFALGKAARRGDQFSDEPNPFKKGEPKPISETRGGNDAAPQLLSMNPKILRGFKTSLAVLLVASVLVGCPGRRDYIIVFTTGDTTGHVPASGGAIRLKDIDRLKAEIAGTNTGQNVVILNIIELDK